MALLVPTLYDSISLDRRHPAVYAEAPSSVQLGPDPIDRMYLKELLDAASRSASIRFEQLYSELFDQLVSLTRIERGWDSYSAPKPNPLAISTTKRVLEALRHLNAEPVAIMPSADGGAGICFMQGEKWAQFEILNNGEAHALMYGGVGSPQAWQIPIDQTDAVRQAWTRIGAYLQS
jgi:hypothetical protein